MDGRRERFGDLYARIAPAVHAWAVLRIAPPLRARLAPEDLVQEVFCRAIEGLPGYDPARAPFRPWIFGIAAKVLLKALRSLSRKPASSHRTGAFDLDEVPAEVTTASRRVARSESMARFLETVDALPEEDRQLLRHRGLEGLEMAEVAERLGVSPEAARKRWQRLRERLQSPGLPDELLLA